MNKLELLFHHKRFLGLHESLQLLSLWDRWIQHDLTQTGDTTTQQEYINVIIYIRKILSEQKFDVRYVPQVTDENSILSWLKVNYNWDKKSMLEFNLEDDFDIVVRNNKYVFRNLTTIKKS